MVLVLVCGVLRWVELSSGRNCCEELPTSETDRLSRPIAGAAPAKARDKEGAGDVARRASATRLHVKMSGSTLAGPGLAAKTFLGRGLL